MVQKPPLQQQQPAPPAKPAAAVPQPHPHRASAASGFLANAGESLHEAGNVLFVLEYAHQVCSKLQHMVMDLNALLALLCAGQMVMNSAFHGFGFTLGADAANEVVHEGEEVRILSKLKNLHWLQGVVWHAVGPSPLST